MRGVRRGLMQSGVLDWWFVAAALRRVLGAQRFFIFLQRSKTIMRLSCTVLFRFADGSFLRSVRRGPTQSGVLDSWCVAAAAWRVLGASLSFLVFAVFEKPKRLVRTFRFRRLIHFFVSSAQFGLKPSESLYR